jgi:CubicO group peptidase (beta-lactamase class C family)
LKFSWKKLALAIVAIVAVAVIVVGYRGYEIYKLGTIGTAYQAQRVCAGVFISGRDVESIVAQDLAPQANDPMEFVIDHENKKVTSTIYGGSKRVAIYREGLGVTVVVGATEDEIRSQSFDPVEPLPKNPESVPWPTGDLDAVDPNPPGVDVEKLNEAVETEFAEPNPEAPRWTRAVVVVHNDKIIAEKYAPGITAESPLMGWSMTKSIASALVGILVGQGRLSVDEPAPVSEWADEGDSRRAITLDHLLHMSSGLEFDDDSAAMVSDTMHMLFRAPNGGEYSLNKPLRREPGSQFSYSTGTTGIISTIMKRELGDEYLSFPRKELFNKIGMRTAVLCPDASGTFVLGAYSYASARDWARFGLLYLHDGMWEGERILPEGWVEYTRTPTTAKYPGGGGYGAHFWLNTSPEPERIGLRWPGLPNDTFSCSGNEGQNIAIIPSRDLVVVRLGMTHDQRGAQWDEGEFVAEVLECLPE